MLNFTNLDVPVIAPFSFPPALKEGERGSAVCAIRSGDTPLDFEWLKDGQVITETKNLKIQSVMESSFLVISSVTSESSGNYTCIVKNAYGSDKFTASLAVTGKSVLIIRYYKYLYDYRLSGYKLFIKMI